MSRGINKTISIGNLTSDPEKRALPSGVAVTNISLAMNQSYKKDGQTVESVEFINVVFFNKLAEIAAEYLKKGSKIYVEGQLKTQSWEKDGVKKYKTEIIAREMQMLDGKSDAPQSNQPSNQPAANNQAPEDFNDDIPF